MLYLYRALLRAAGFATLPSGVKWDYYERPAMPGLCAREELPMSIYRYGVISTDRKLTEAEQEAFDLQSI